MCCNGLGAGGRAGTGHKWSFPGWERGDTATIPLPLPLLRGGFLPGAGIPLHSHSHSHSLAQPQHPPSSGTSSCPAHPGWNTAQGQGQGCWGCQGHGDGCGVGMGIDVVWAWGWPWCGHGHSCGVGTLSTASHRHVPAQGTGAPSSSHDVSAPSPTSARAPGVPQGWGEVRPGLEGLTAPGAAWAQQGSSAAPIPADEGAGGLSGLG